MARPSEKVWEQKKSTAGGASEKNDERAPAGGTQLCADFGAAEIETARRQHRSAFRLHSACTNNNCGPRRSLGETSSLNAAQNISSVHTETTAALRSKGEPRDDSIRHSILAF